MAEFVVVAGLSGTGRTTAANVFEDRGWCVIDNLPSALISQVRMACHVATACTRTAHA